MTPSVEDPDSGTGCLQNSSSSSFVHVKFLNQLSWNGLRLDITVSNGSISAYLASTYHTFKVVVVKLRQGSG